MPNHVHAVVWPYPGHTIGEILHGWKSYTASEASRTLLHEPAGFWQNESFDHWIRDNDERLRLIAGVEYNPVKASLCAEPEDWLRSSAHDRTVATGILPAAAGGIHPPGPKPNAAP